MRKIFKIIGRIKHTPVLQIIGAQKDKAADQNKKYQFFHAVNPSP